MFLVSLRSWYGRYLLKVPWNLNPKPCGWKINFCMIEPEEESDDLNGQGNDQKRKHKKESKVRIGFFLPVRNIREFALELIR